MAAPLDCLCAGIVVADSVCQPLATMPPPGTLARTERVEFSIGGCAANVAVDMAKLGLHIGVSGRVGNDVFGREVRDRLVASSVDCSGLVLSPTSPTSSTFVLNVRGEDRRFIHCVGANAEYDGRQVTDDEIRSAKVLYVGGFGLLEGLTPECVARMFQIARKAHVTTVLDVVLPEVGNLAGWIETVAPLTDYFFPNNDEAERLCSETDPVRQAHHFRDLGVNNVVITCGSRGSVLLGPQGRFESDIYSVEAVDATGTGDAFVAGFLFGLLRGDETSERLRLGTAMGASCVQSMGATTGVFSSDELLAFVKTNPLSVRHV
jgi:sugar/nucleoside kinase (ribokinase family)